MFKIENPQTRNNGLFKFLSFFILQDKCRKKSTKYWKWTKNKSFDAYLYFVWLIAL